MGNKPVSPWTYIIFVGLIVIVAIYIFTAGGFSLDTFFAFLGWVLTGMGFFAFLGGERKNGIIAMVIGIILANILQWI